MKEEKEKEEMEEKEKAKAKMMHGQWMQKHLGCNPRLDLGHFQVGSLHYGSLIEGLYTL